MATAIAMAGAPGLAVAKQLATMLFSDVFITLINVVVLPLSYAFIAVSLAHAALGNDGLKRIAGFIKWTVTLLMGAFLLSFIGYLNISSVIAGSAYATTIKAAQFTVSNMVPVVGRIFSSAAESVLAGPSIFRPSLGVFGLL